MEKKNCKHEIIANNVAGEGFSCVICGCTSMYPAIYSLKYNPNRIEFDVWNGIDDELRNIIIAKYKEAKMENRDIKKYMASFKEEIFESTTPKIDENKRKKYIRI